jgi:hypothetical protein
VATDASGATSTEDLRSFVINPAMITPRFTTPGQYNEFRFDFNGLNSQEYTVEISSDLVTWVPLSSFTAQSGASSVSDATTTGVPRRFYRIVPKP